VHLPEDGGFGGRDVLLDERTNARERVLGTGRRLKMHGASMTQQFGLRFAKAKAAV
jgi:hypothetical protein